MNIFMKGSEMTEQEQIFLTKIIAVLSGALSIILLVVDNSLSVLSEFFLLNPLILHLLVFMTFLTSISILFLHSSSNNKNEKTLESIEQKNLIEEMMKTIEQLKSEQKDLTDEEKDKLKERIISHTNSELVQKIFSDETHKLENKLLDNMKLKVFENSSKRIIDRLEKQVNALTLRSMYNLIIGMLITVFGLYILLDTINLFNTINCYNSPSKCYG